MFDACVDALAPRGRLLTIGHMSQYADGWAKRPYPGLAEKLLWKSATLQGFFLLHYASHWRRHLKKLAGLFQGGQLRVQVGPASTIASGSDGMAPASGAPRRGAACVCHRAADGPQALHRAGGGARCGGMVADGAFGGQGVRADCAAAADGGGQASAVSDSVEHPGGGAGAAAGQFFRPSF